MTTSRRKFSIAWRWTRDNGISYRVALVMMAYRDEELLKLSKILT